MKYTLFGNIIRIVISSVRVVLQVHFVEFKSVIYNDLNEQRENYSMVVIIIIIIVHSLFFTFVCIF